MKETLQRIVEVLEKIYPEKYPQKKLGFYYGCSYCETTDPEISCSGHQEECEWKTMRDLIFVAQFKLLEEEEKAGR